MNHRVPNGSMKDSRYMKPTWAARLGGEGGRLETELDRHPQHVKVSEMHHLAVEIGAPATVDHDRQEQARDQKEIRHPEWLCERSEERRVGKECRSRWSP